MKTLDLPVVERTSIGKASNKKLRREGSIPGVLYDNASVTHLAVNLKELRPAVYTKETYILNLAIEGGETVQAIIREAQFHRVTEKPLHIDFMRVSADKEVILELPVVLVGTPAGVSKGGKLVTKLRRIKVKGIPQNLPDSVEIDVSELELGGTIKVSDAGITGLQVITSQSAGVASVEIPRALRSATAAQEAGEEATEEV
ncbi:MAG: 50S ribosomal protein L25 [Bacteroidota bacterium]